VIPYFRTMAGMLRSPDPRARSGSSTPRERTFAIVQSIILGLAVIRVGVPVLRENPHPRVRWAETINTAYSLYKFGKYADPFPSLPTGPSAHVAPGFPVFVAGLYSIFGDGPAGARALAFAEAAAVLVQIGMLPAVVRALGAGPTAGLFAALLATAGVWRLPESEGSYVAVLLILATLLACRFCRILESDVRSEPATSGGAAAPGSPYGVAWLSGALWGLILLTNPAVAPVWAAWVLLGALRSRKSRWRFAWLPALLLPLFLILPWTVRNYRALGGFVPVRSNLGMELRIGNNVCGAVMNTRSSCDQHPATHVAEARKVAQAGEIQYNRAQMSAALAWIRQNPKRAAGLWLRRAEVFWFPSSDGTPWRTLLSRKRWLWIWTVDLATLLSLPGIVLLYWKNWPAAVICAPFLLAYPITYYLIQYDARYRLPIMWVSFVLASIALSSFAAVARGRLMLVFRAFAARDALSLLRISGSEVRRS
jgi:hypothetical protein